MSSARQVFIFCALLADAHAALAHHSPAAFELQSSISIEGVVKRFYWAAPHVYIDVEATGPDGVKAVWSVEGAWPTDLMLRGWSRTTLKYGDKVRISGNPARNPKKHSMMGRQVRKADGTVLVFYQAPNALGIDAGPAQAPRSNLAAAQALVGVWLPLNANPLPVLLGAANDRLGTGADVADCVHHAPPVDMVFNEPREISARGGDFVLRLNVDGDVERTVHMNSVAYDGRVTDRQGYSTGHWEDNVLVVQTAFNVPGAGGYLQSRATKLVERFALAPDHNQLRYQWSLESPGVVEHPLSGNVDWAWRPDMTVPNLKCDRQIARRYLDDK
jgi:hypothetical protein